MVRQTTCFIRGYAPHVAHKNSSERRNYVRAVAYKRALKAENKRARQKIPGEFEIG